MPLSSGDSKWFEAEFGFEEPVGSFDRVQEAFSIECADDGAVQLTSKANGRSFFVGPFEVPSLIELRERLSELKPNGAPGEDICSQEESLGGISFENIAGDARSLHMSPDNAGAVFQVASQFNCLEMIGPGERPESGVTQYYKDKTQGPVCAMACPAATVYRNYLVPSIQPGVSRIGQAGGSTKQLDTTQDVAAMVGNRRHKYWTMKNGYLLPTEPNSLKQLNARIHDELVEVQGMQVPLSDAITSNMRLGVHWNTEVAKARRPAGTDAHRVCQVFSSAVPVAYAKSTNSADWAPLANSILDAQYEGTLAVAAILASMRQCRVRVFLTSVGGGAFGNRSLWIVRALERALYIHKDSPLDVHLVHYMRVPKGDFTTVEKKFPNLHAARRVKQRTTSKV